MHFTDQDDQVFFSQFYGISWLLGFFFIFIAILTLYTTFLGNSLDEVEIWQVNLVRFSAFSIFFAGLYVIYLHPKHMIWVDRKTNLIELKISGFLRNESTVFTFQEVRNFSLDTKKDDEDSIYYEITMNLADGKSLQITKSFHKIKSHYDSIIESLNNQIKQ